MRIGILTFHCAHNYGAMLQCYALQEYLKGRGDEVYVIDYRPDYLTHPYKKHKLSHWLSKDPLRTLKRLLSEPFLLKKRGKRWDGFDNFMRMKLNLYPYDMSSDYSNFDWLLFGSDQIWNNLRSVVHDLLFASWDCSFYIFAIACYQICVLLYHD